MTAQRPLTRGLLVALEGIDGTGKSTQAARLADIFAEQGYAVALLREPTMSPWGRRIRAAMTASHRVLAPAQELELFLQDRRYDVAAHINPALAAHKLVLMDRYYFSTIAYQGALGFDPNHIRRLNEAFAPHPDLVLVLLLPPAQALERIRQARGYVDRAFEREDHLHKVDSLYRTLSAPQIHYIDAAQPCALVTAALRQKIQSALSEHCHSSHPPQSAQPSPCSPKGEDSGKAMVVC
jgi:dTMP kinase